MLGIWRRKAVTCGCDAPRNAVREWKSWDGWYGKARLPDALPLEARPEHDAADLLRHLSDTVRSERWFSRGQRKLFGVGKPGRAIRHAFDYQAAPRRMNKPAHRFGCIELTTAYRFAEGEQRDYFMIDANSTPGKGRAVEDRMAFLREPGEPNAR